jgi:hypothetical protein
MAAARSDPVCPGAPFDAGLPCCDDGNGEDFNACKRASSNGRKCALLHPFTDLGFEFRLFNLNLHRPTPLFLDFRTLAAV